MLKGTKFDVKKPDYTLLPWAQVESVVKVLDFGAIKYQRENWKKVKNGEQRYRSAAFRHLSKIEQGEEIDSETGQSHYSHAICSLLFAHWHQQTFKLPGKVKRNKQMAVLK